MPENSGKDAMCVGGDQRESAGTELDEVQKRSDKPKRGVAERKKKRATTGLRKLKRMLI